ncbi:MAG TPA: sigma-70 family RNA polymerase sigma factor [Verrucomicrobiales bacterium]|nr:sigma-70 family RNA polymerase sigma factor [Verrucomicrobiales bacterium]
MTPAAPPSIPSNEELLRQCAHEPGTAFRTLVERYAGLVRATAWRQTEDFHTAEDIVQTVFCALAREAAKIKGSTLGAWLHRRTLYEVSHWRRAEFRRRRRERIAHEKVASPGIKESAVAPAELDAALNVLPDKDREMLLLRCVEKRDWRSIGALMGLTDDTAQKRVARALEKVRRALAAQGVVKSGSALTGVIALSAVVPPAHAFASVTQVATAVLAHTGSAAPPASSALGGMFAAGALPVVMLATGVVLPLATLKNPPPAHVPVIAAAPSPPAKPASPVAKGPVPDAAALRAMLKYNTQLERLRLRRALGLLDASACQAVLAEFAKAPGALSGEYKIYGFLRAETEERWIQSDPRHAALSGYLKDNNFPERAIRYLATKDFPAAQSLAAEAKGLWRPGGDPYYHDLIAAGWPPSMSMRLWPSRRPPPQDSGASFSTTQRRRSRRKCFGSSL